MAESQNRTDFASTPQPCLAVRSIYDAIIINIDNMFLDLPKAFDTADHTILLFKLYNFWVFSV